MKSIRFALMAITLMGLVSLIFVSMPAAQDQAPPSKAAAVPTPRMPDGHPDLTGYWAGNDPKAFTPQKTDGDIPGVDSLTRAADGSLFYDYGGAENPGDQLRDLDTPLAPPNNQASYKLEYMAKVKQIASTMYGGTTALDPQQDCKPHGVPRAGFGAFVVSSPVAVAMLYEASPGPYYRLVYTDGREHPKDLDTSYFGHSIGHWDGDTLVVDTVGLNDETWLGGGQFTTIHSDKEHVAENIARKGNTITYQATVDDPVMLTKPWVLAPRKIQLSPPDPDKYYIQPQMCLNNDKPHLIQETATDKWKCTWCQKDADKIYGPGAAADKAKADKEAKAQGRLAGGGDE
jgi:hypothetical protein